MKLDKYPIKSNATATVYEFTSEGSNGSVEKLVVYSTTHLHDFYNLGFGDKDGITGDISDTIVTNNGDTQKVLSTVAATAYTFTDKYPDAMIFATGSTEARTRLYRMGITRHLQAIELDFQVFGLVNNKWQPFKTGVPYVAFLVKRKSVTS